jgi:hypothetical protein
MESLGAPGWQEGSQTRQAIAACPAAADSHPDTIQSYISININSVKISL